MNRVLVVCSLLIVFLLAGSPLAQGPVAVPAARLADSVGVNVHLHHTDTGYGNFELIKWLLAQLGVGHVRDGLIDTAWQGYYDRHNALGAIGIKGIFVAPPVLSDATLRNYPSKMARSFEGYELPNELDASGLPGVDRDAARLARPVPDPRRRSAPDAFSRHRPLAHDHRILCGARRRERVLRQRQPAQLHGRPQSRESGLG